MLVAETSAVPGAVEGAKPPGEPNAKIIGKSKEEVELRLGLWRERVVKTTWKG